MTDKQMFTEVFRNLRKKGFVARQNYQCCRGCGWAAIEENYKVEEDSNVVFYHRQDNESFDKDGFLKSKIYLRWSGDAEQIIKEFEEYGYKIEWEGTEENAIGIHPWVKKYVS